MDTYQVHTKNPGKLNVCFGIMGSTVIDPFFIDGTLTGRLYLQLLQETFLPGIVATIGNDASDCHSILQQDGIPQHFYVLIREYLDEVFPGCELERRRHTEWSPRSPDLDPCDFLL